MKKYRLYQIDSFTKERFSGNPAGVITNADGLNELQMQKIAKELNNSETAFIFPPQSSDHDMHVRFFTPSKEVPICGHATIAAHYARAVENNLETSRVYHKTGAGVLPVDIIKENDNYRIIMTQGKPEFQSIIEGKSKQRLISALGIEMSDVLESHPIQIVSTGHSKVMIGIKSLRVLHSLRPNSEALINLSETIRCNGYYVYTITSGKDPLVHGRMFAPAIGISEDPVTGNANGPLGAYLIHHNLVKHDNSSYTFRAIQGEAIGRAGIIEINVRIEDNKPSEVTVSGNAVIVFKSELML